MPDITYCVNVVNSNSSSTLHSECGINETEFSYPIPPDSQCNNYTFIVIPVNLVGNGSEDLAPYVGAQASKSLLVLCCCVLIIILGKRIITVKAHCYNTKGSKVTKADSHNYLSCKIRIIIMYIYFYVIKCSRHTYMTIVQFYCTCLRRPARDCASAVVTCSWQQQEIDEELI